MSRKISLIILVQLCKRALNLKKNRFHGFADVHSSYELKNNGRSPIPVCCYNLRRSFDVEYQTNSNSVSPFSIGAE